MQLPFTNHIPAKEKTGIKADHLFWIGMVLIHFFYFFCAVAFGNIYTLDSPEYLATAKNLLLHGQVYNGDWAGPHHQELYSLRPPLYGFFILAAKQIIDSEIFVLFVQNLLSIYLWFLFLKLNSLLGGSKRMKPYILITMLLFPTQMIMVNSIMADLLLELLLLISVLQFVNCLNKRNMPSVFGCNISLVLAVFTKPVMMYFWVINTSFAVFLFFKGQSRVLIFASFLLPMSAFIWCKRNEAKTGLFHFSSIKPQNMLDLNAGGVLKFKFGEEKSHKMLIDLFNQSEKLQDLTQKTDFMMAESFRIINENKLIYVYVHLKGMLNFMLATCRTDLIDFFPIHFEENSSLIADIETGGVVGFIHYVKKFNLFYLVFMTAILIWNIILLVSTLDFAFNKRVDMNIRLFILLIIVYVCFVCGPGGYPRLKMCVLPLMMLNLPFTIERLKEAFQKISSHFKFSRG